MKIDTTLTVQQLASAVQSTVELAGKKVQALHQRWVPHSGAPVFTIRGQYTARGWTEWTQGFQFGQAILHYDLTNAPESLEIGRSSTLGYMATHLSHVGVHDHGFNNVSTYGNLLRLMNEGRLPENAWERHFYELALKVSGAVQAARWTQLTPDLGYVYSFNGPHSLFSDTIRSMRVLALSHQLGHVLMGEKDQAINLLKRLWQHAEATASYNVYFGQGRDAYDLRGRVVHESIFNQNDGSYRCPSSQQGYSPFSTWTRGQAWIICGYAEQLEYLHTLSDQELSSIGGRQKVVARFEEVMEAVGEFWVKETPECGIPYWDTGAPGLAKMGDYLSRPADPYNAHEPVDSSAAAIAAQGFLRYGRYLSQIGRNDQGRHYYQVALTITKNLLADPYLSRDDRHEGLLLHSVYHRPNGWDYLPDGGNVPYGESCMWGDYHALELALMIHREIKQQPYYKFFL
jgi:hypothetical protein